MCRHLAYLGPPTLLERLVYTPEWSLERQSYEPRRQSAGKVNADGFGVGWYAPDVRAEPALYRSAGPIWADRSFRSVAGVVSSSAVVASVRSATPPSPVEVSGAQPFASGRWLFCHNGEVFGYRAGVRAKLLRLLSDERLSAIEGDADSEVLFALALETLARGGDAACALRSVVEIVDGLEGGRVNLLLTEGEQIVATARGASLFVHTDEKTGSVIVASEPFDDAPGWTAVPDGSLVVAAAGRYETEGLL